MIKHALGTIAVALLLTLAVPAIATAHVLKADGHIGAVLHINPDDYPTTGNNTDYILSFVDDTGRFSLPNCNCNVSVIENGKTIATKALVVSGDGISENHYIFVKPDVYDMRFIGIPKTPNAFQPFTLDYEVRVGQVNNQPMPFLLWVGMGMGIGLVLLAAFALDYDTNEPINKDYQ
jgi:hypothetical protein